MKFKKKVFLKCLIFKSILYKVTQTSFQKNASMFFIWLIICWLPVKEPLGENTESQFWSLHVHSTVEAFPFPFHIYWNPSSTRILLFLFLSCLHSFPIQSKFQPNAYFKTKEYCDFLGAQNTELTLFRFVGYWVVIFFSLKHENMLRIDYFLCAEMCQIIQKKIFQKLEHLM